MPEEGLVLAGITKDFGRRRILESVDLRVAPGETVALTGPNGAGKSTLLAIASTTLRPTAGSVTVDGTDGLRDGARARQRTGWLPQAPALYPDLTPREHLQWWRRLHGVGDVDAMLRTAGLAAAAGRPCRELSGGQRQRVALALALLHDPPVLLLDEPTQGLDAEGLRWLQAVLAGAPELRDSPRAILVATHAPGLVGAHRTLHLEGRS